MFNKLFLESDCTRSVSSNGGRGHLLLTVNVSIYGSMRDAWSFSRRQRRRITSTFQRRYESTPLSQFTGSFAILPLLGRPRTIRATPIVPILDALVSQTRVWPEILRGASPLCSPEMRYISDGGEIIRDCSFRMSRSILYICLRFRSPKHRSETLGTWTGLFGQNSLSTFLISNCRLLNILSNISYYYVNIIIYLRFKI